MRDAIARRMRSSRLLLLAGALSLSTALPLSAAALPAPAPPPAAQAESAMPCPAPARRFARDTGGHITNGPSIVDERVIGQRDAAGNIHVDPNAKGCPYVPHHHR
jgi:hypothetical protein